MDMFFFSLGKYENCLSHENKHNKKIAMKYLGVYTFFVIYFQTS